VSAADMPAGYRLAEVYSEVEAANDAGLRAYRPRDERRYVLRVRYRGRWVPAQCNHGIRRRRAPAYGTPPGRFGVLLDSPEWPTSRTVPVEEIAILWQDPEVDR
jgi:hypothetical protein